MKLWLVAVSILALAFVAIAVGARHFVAADPASQAVDHEFTLRTGIAEGRMAYVGVGSEIEGVVNPTLVLRAGTNVRMTVRNGDGIEHDLAIEELAVNTGMTSAKGAEAEAVFAVQVDQVGTYNYYCTVPGHRQAGMEGQLVVQ